MGFAGVRIVSFILACSAALLLSCFVDAADNPAANVKFTSMLNKQGDLAPDDLAYLIDRKAELKAWADVCLRNLPIAGDLGDIPNPKLARLIAMVAESDPVEAERLSGKVLNIAAEVIKEVKSRKGEIITKAFLASGEAGMEKAGIQAAGRQYPNLLIRALEMRVVEQVPAAIEELGRNKVAAALPVLRNIAKDDPREDIRAIASLAIACITGDAPAESMVSSDPKATARAYVTHVKANSEWFTDDELQFMLNPVLESARGMRGKWSEFVAGGRNTIEGRKELEKRNQLAANLGDALAYQASFTIRGNACSVSVDGRIVTTLYKDMLGRWRLYRNP